ncbi:MAG: HAD-IB family phosphatase [Desulfatiglandaceae bacterium]
MNEPEKTITLSAIGLDKPGLVSLITGHVFDMGGNIMDVEENSRRGLFSIFLIIDFSHSSMSMDPIMERLNALEGQTDLQIVLGRYQEDHWFDAPEKESHLVTVLGMDQPGIIARIADFLSQHHINIETCKMVARGRFFSMEMMIDTRAIDKPEQISHWEAVSQVKADLKALCHDMGQGVVIQSRDISNKMKKLVVFDVETTLLDASSLRQFMKRISGNIEDRGRTLLDTVKKLQGMPVSELERFGELLQLNPGAFELIRILKSMGFKIALLSSGLDLFMHKVLEKAGVDYAFSNTLEKDQAGKITGRLQEPLITDDTKEEILEFIMDTEGITRDQVIAVGDGSTRSHFIKNAGLSIAFKPDENGIVTDGILNGDQIIHVLYCLGIPKTEIDKYIEH